MNPDKWVWRNGCGERCDLVVDTKTTEFQSIWGNQKKSANKENCFNWNEFEPKFWFEYPCREKMGFVCQFKASKPIV